MTRIIRKSLATFALAATALLVAPISQADTASQPTGAAYLVAGGVNSTVNGASGNGIPGPRSAVAVPEPSSWAAFGLGIALISTMLVARRRSDARSENENVR